MDWLWVFFSLGCCFLLGLSFGFFLPLVFCWVFFVHIVVQLVLPYPLFLLRYCSPALKNTTNFASLFKPATFDMCIIIIYFTGVFSRSLLSLQQRVLNNQTKLLLEPQQWKSSQHRGSWMVLGAVHVQGMGV